jgi:hypothetical protein
MNSEIIFWIIILVWFLLITSLGFWLAFRFVGRSEFFEQISTFLFVAPVIALSVIIYISL